MMSMIKDGSSEMLFGEGTIIARWQLSFPSILLSQDDIRRQERRGVSHSPFLIPHSLLFIYQRGKFLSELPPLFLID